jgi:hypothetical protein
MRVMAIVKASKASESETMPDPAILEAMGKLNQEMAAAGVMIAAEGLHASKRGKRVNFSGKNRTVTDGPFAETKELIGGFWILQVKDMDEAVAWMRKAPNPHGEDAHIELRPIIEVEDFADLMAEDHVQRIKDFRAGSELREK